MSSRIALRCGFCGCFVTPCLVCAHPVAVGDKREWRCCECCGVCNPLDDPARQALGFAPALALPPATVRLAKAALVGRRAYTLSMYEYRAHLDSDRKERFLPKSSLPFSLIENAAGLAQERLDEVSGNDDADADAASDEKTKCQGCGLICTKPRAPETESDELSLVQCSSVLLDLSCAQALADDLSRHAFPICRMPEKLTLASNYPSCGAVQELTNFSLKLLELASGTLSEHFDEVPGPPPAAVARFLARKKELQDSQVSIRTSREALQQALRDCNACDKFPQAAALLKAHITGNLEQEQQSAKKQSQEFSQLPSEINTALEKTFSLAADLSRCPAANNEATMEALRIAATQWLLLFHEVYHTLLP